MSGSSDESDAEGPEQLSFDSSKAQAVQEARKLADLVNKDKAAVKQKRRERQELYKKQKLEKESKASKLVFTDAVLDQIRSEGAQQPQVSAPSESAEPLNPDSTVTFANDDEDTAIQTQIHVQDEEKRKQPIIKSYKALNIDVRSLPQLPNPRRSAAVSFRARRFAKVQRESVSMNLVHAEKLRVAGKL